MARRLPWTGRLWLRRHRSHGPARLNTTISVGLGDPTARGILAVCPCGKVGAW